MLISLIEPIQGKLGADKISFHSSSTRDPCLSKSPIFEWSNQKECWRKSPDYAEHFERLEWGGFGEDASGLLDNSALLDPAHTPHFPRAYSTPLSVIGF